MNKIELNLCGLDITITKNNIHIKDSWKISTRDAQKYILTELRDFIDDSSITMDNPLNHRSDYSLINEWVSHNNAYKLGYKKERTGSVDLNWPQKWYMSIVYFICSLITL